MKRLLVLFLAVVLPCGAVFSQKKETYRVRTIVIDPGHGGAKPGAKGALSWEKDITLDVALKFGKLLRDNYPDLNIIYTRTTDEDISLAQRAHIANSNKADLFVSIHANSHPTASPTGVETFVMGLSESKANLEVAKKENADILLEADYKNNQAYSGFDPNAPETYVMLAMFQNAFIDKSLNLAQAIQTQYKSNLKTINRGVKQAELYVLYKTTCPSVLTEIGFISNPTEEAFMLSDEGQAQIAVCLFNAFMTYKATEEGSDRPANPKIDLPGYGTNVAAATPQPTPSQPADTGLAQVAAPPQQQQQQPQQPAAKPLPPVELPQRQPSPTPDDDDGSAQVAADTTLQPPHNTAKPGATDYYTVQFLVAPVLYESGAAQLGGITEFDASHKAQSYVYTTGRFASYKEAAQYCEHLKQASIFKDSWVFLMKGATPQQPAAAAQQGQSAPAKAAPAATTAPAKKGTVTYRVQFCTSRRQMKAGDPDLHGIKDVRSGKSGRAYVYTTGNFSTAAEARRRCDEIKRTTPFNDAFVIAIYDGQRITLERAAEIEKKNKK